MQMLVTVLLLLGRDPVTGVINGRTAGESVTERERDAVPEDNGGRVGDDDAAPGLGLAGPVVRLAKVHPRVGHERVADGQAEAAEAEVRLAELGAVGQGQVVVDPEDGEGRRAGQLDAQLHRLPFAHPHHLAAGQSSDEGDGHVLVHRVVSDDEKKLRVTQKFPSAQRRRCRTAPFEADGLDQSASVDGKSRADGQTNCPPPPWPDDGSDLVYFLVRPFRVDRITHLVDPPDRGVDDPLR